MTQLTKFVRLATAIVISVALGACGGSAKSPVAPGSGPAPSASATPAPTSTITSGATIDGTVVGVSGSQRLGLRALAAGPSVSVAGTNISSPIDPSGRFSLQGVPTGDVELQVSTNNTTAMLPVTGVSTNEQIHLTIAVNGSTATADDSDRETTDNRAEVEGKITAISGNTLTVAGKTVTVPPGIPIQHGGTAVAFTDLKVGERIHVHGTRSGAGVIATSIEVQPENPGNPGPPDNPGDDRNDAEVKGTIASLTGSCPALAFTIQSTKVSTNATTKFAGIACSSLANGTSVEVEGAKQSDGSIVASTVKADK